MSFYEKYTNSTFYHFTDALFKFLLLNVLMLLTTIMGLFIIGLPVALLAGVITIRMIFRKGASGIFILYFRNIKYVFKRSLKTIITFSILLFVLGFNVFFFYSGLEPFNWYNFLSFIFMLLTFGLTFISYMHALMLSSVYDINIKSIVRHSYLLSMGFSIRGILFIFGFVLILYIILLIPILGIMFGLSTFSLLIYVALVTGYSKVESLTEAMDLLITTIYD